MYCRKSYQRFLALLVVLFIVGCASEPGQPFTIITSTYSNGQKKVVEIHADKTADSKLLRREIYSPKAELISVEDLASNSLMEYRYFPNGKKQAVQVLRDKKPDGTWKRWYPNGVLAVEMNYRNGKNHGTWKYWDAQGKLSRQIEYWDGKIRWEKSEQ
ncbi:MAG: hypothetical protein K9N34_06470 [Candidatus Marinimicrobia bacterium]|nr:hypothetical protein [Candidatus Neomarinimicrobiota bacterium]MCF7840487.1 hypothetical protein [Candidatus Neomarinimicrobiota bacterium]